MKKKPLRGMKDFSREVVPDAESPQWSRKDFQEAKPFKEGFPELYDGWKRGRGRPKAAQTKQKIMLRLDPEIIESFRALGPGWMTQMNNVLKDASKHL